MMKRMTSLIWLALFMSMSFAPGAFAAELSNREKAIIVLILENTDEVKIHQMRGETGNRVFQHKDGHREAVFDAQGKAVKNGYNDASYNIANPRTQPLGHFILDISPWIDMGNSRTDPTDKKERIYAYMGDIEGGIRGAIKQQDKISNAVITYDETQQNALSKWSDIMDHEPARKVFTLFDGDAEVSDSELIAALKPLYEGFQKAY